MSLTETTKREFSKRVLDILNSNADTLKKAGVDVCSKSPSQTLDYIHPALSGKTF